MQNNLPPIKSIQQGEKTKVWVLDKDSSLSSKAIEIGASDGVNVQILSGIQEGDKLVYSLKQTSQEISKVADSESPFMPQRPGGDRKK